MSQRQYCCIVRNIVNWSSPQLCKLSSTSNSLSMRTNALPHALQHLLACVMQSLSRVCILCSHCSSVSLTSHGLVCSVTRLAKCTDSTEGLHLFAIVSRRQLILNGGRQLEVGGNWEQAAFGSKQHLVAGSSW